MPPLCRWTWWTECSPDTSVAQRLRNYLDFLGDTAATKPPLFCHRYILSVIVVWWHRICAGVDIWGQFCTCRSADFTCIMFTSLYRLIRWESDPADLKNGFSTKFYLSWCIGVVVVIYFIVNNAMWCIMVGGAFCVMCDFFMQNLTCRSTTDLTPPISRLVDGI